MPGHMFTGFRARVESGAVRLSFYLTTPLFESKRSGKRPLRIRIYRNTESRFAFGKDYEEYFGGLGPGKAGVAFEGYLPAINRRKYEYLDREVRTGSTYAYWVTSDRATQPTGPVPVRVRDTRIWWPQSAVEERLAALAEAHGKVVSLKRYGRTVGGRPIVGVVAGITTNLMALVGTIHAGESGPELAIPALERLLEEDPAILERAGLAMLPNVNIDERERMVAGCPWYLRVNMRGVDLNRNFNADWKEVDCGYGLVSSDPDAVTYRGPWPASEPETRAVVSFLEHAKPRAVLSYHALASITGAMLLAPGAAEGDRAFAAECRAIARRFTRGFYPEERAVKLAFGATPGSLPAYAYRRFRVPAFDLEWDGNPDAKPSHADKTTCGLLETYQDRHYRGIVAVLEFLAARH